MSQVEWLAAFDDAKGQVQQFPHSSTDDNHHGLSLIEQVFVEGLNHRIKAPSIDSREVKRLAQVTTANLRQPPLTFKRRARLVLSRRQSDERSQLSGASEIGKVNLSQQLVSRDATDTRDALEQFRVSFEGGMPVDVVVDGRLDRTNLLVQISDHRLERIPDYTLQAGLEPVLFLLLKVFEVLEPPNQRLELFGLRSHRHPRLGLLLETEAGDDEGVLFVGLVAAQPTLGIVLDAFGVDNTDQVTFGYEELRTCVETLKKKSGKAEV